MHNKQPKIIVLTGPESTGKSTLSKELSIFYNADLVSEYAREYIESIDRPYLLKDVNVIAKQQVNGYKKALLSIKPMVVFDTFLIITKIWYREVFGFVPEWIDDAIVRADVDLHLLCYPDTEWIEDSVRENKHKRMYLFEQYKNELEYYNFDYEIVKGQGEERLKAAINKINQKLQ
ncbi:ATP-binding protein [Carboxylicivirga marina]|uniref:ATP-binding protein n=1 Tax=Carboxylicivirga marina TaxID=2800988 RepID=UPI002597DD36|nr:ATP-binding protein [uncultured Carboxylicivirga sp.]